MTVPGDDAKIRLILSLRLQGINDTAILSAIERLPREEFVPTALSHRAWDDAALPIAAHQTISQPFIVAFMTQALRLQKRHTVLEIGTGSGYQAALLAEFARRVYTIERHRTLREGAEAKFQALKLSNIVTRLGDGTKGWPQAAPFDRVLVTAAGPSVPQPLLDQLAPGGVLVAPVGPDPDHQHIIRMTATDDGFVTETLMPVRFVPLVEGLPG
ncbi:protein-L-isoaspartate(D-aspartate) O-methyltransferase [Zavarzinia sp. CC-PAN008]|uniref:protein-L-isoaspartate(D-aspartate) O-methyltransferase n=1 Tax=Zavarzinia sp. CC-PAN008 TaxID=3243332 RepID=UPI003F7474B3